VVDDGVVRRYGRVGRWFHAGIYVTVLLALGTGWWFVIAGYERESPLARLTGQPDGAIHELSGYAMLVVLVVWIPFGVRGVRSFLRESARFDRGDGRWLLGWPRATFTGRFGSHSGHFDPDQRLANIVIVVLLAVVVITGLGAIDWWSSGLWAAMFGVHRWASYAMTPVLLGHIVVAAGILPGYRACGGRCTSAVDCPSAWPAASGPPGSIRPTKVPVIMELGTAERADHGHRSMIAGFGERRVVVGGRE
jgi:cytochrome b subunit of formate dehydrogenase